MSKTIVRPRSAEFEHRLSSIDQYDMWFVTERISRDHLLPESEIEDAMLQFKRFASLVAIGFKNLTMPVENIDIVWHTFLLFTQEYQEFCLQCIGSYLHHRPLTSRTVKNDGVCVDFYTAYKHVYGEDLRQRVNEQSKCCGGDNCRSGIKSIPAFA